MTPDEALQYLKDFITDPSDTAKMRRAVRVLSRLERRRLQRRKDHDPGWDDRTKCPRCWGGASDELGDETLCRVCGGDGSLPK